MLIGVYNNAGLLAAAAAAGPGVQAVAGRLAALASRNINAIMAVIRNKVF
ncbi:hypothetical protein JCM19000A_07100 [Silvimonas sp. JCM 19000]